MQLISPGASPSVAAERRRSQDGEDFGADTACSDGGFISAGQSLTTTATLPSGLARPQACARGSGRQRRPRAEAA
jgi:hypothetical protein